MASRLKQDEKGDERMEKQQKKADIPYIDPNVQYVGVSKLRTLNATNLNKLDKTLVIQDNEAKPLAVVLSYEQFMAIQREREKILDTINAAIDDEDRKGLIAGLRDVSSGKTKPLSEIRDGLIKEKQ